jgi:APA family basic amino acid/polyamine antiporter
MVNPDLLSAAMEEAPYTPQHESRAGQLLKLFRQKAFTTLSVEEQTGHRSASGAEMRRVLGPFDLVMLGLGGIIGAGVFVLTGVAAHSYAG